MKVARSNLWKLRYKGGNASFFLNDFFKPKSNHTRWTAIEEIPSDLILRLKRLTWGLMMKTNSAKLHCTSWRHRGWIILCNITINCVCLKSKTLINLLFSSSSSLHLFFGITGNSEQKNILQITWQETQINYLFL